MKIALAHFGISKTFKQKQTQLDIDFQKLVINLSRNNPQDQFYVFVSNEKNLNAQNKIMFPHSNVYPLGDFPVDLMIVYTGPTCRVNNNNSIPNGTGGFKKTLLMFQKYCGPIINYLNKFKPKFIALSIDPRNSTIPAFDLYHRPFLHIGQSEFKGLTYQYNPQDNYSVSPVPVDCKFYPIHQIRLLDTVPDIPTNIKSGFGIICNPGADEGSKECIARWPILEEYVLNQISNPEIFGKWKKEHPALKGFVPHLELQKRINDWKYTLCIPIQKEWISPKYLESIQSGIIPFFHPLYDEKRNLVVPDILRLEKPSDLITRIEYLDNNPAEYEAVRNSLKLLISSEDWNSGKILNEYLYSTITDNYEFKHVPTDVKVWDDYFQNPLLTF